MTSRKRILIAPTAFKGSLSPEAAANLIHQKISELAFFDCSILPLTDGGTGTLSCLNSFQSEQIVEETYLVTGPLMTQTVSAKTIKVTDSNNGKPAYQIIEAAQAHGITLLPKDINQKIIYSPLKATSFGVGELMTKVTQSIKSCPLKEWVVTLGGSASTDAGAGALQALGWQFFSQTGLIVHPIGGEDLGQIVRINPPSSISNYDGLKLTVLTDVTNPLLGDNGTVAVFSPQKGASLYEQRFLEDGLEHFHSLMTAAVGTDYSNKNGAGAAGGLGYGLFHHAHYLQELATVESGFEWFSKKIKLKTRLQNTDWVISGEGCLDLQSFSGKTIGQLIQMIEQIPITHSRPQLVLFCGKLGEDLKPMAIRKSILPSFVSLYVLSDFQTFPGESSETPKAVLHRAITQWLTDAQFDSAGNQTF